MADSQGLPNNPAEYTVVINWLNAHPGYSAGWDRFRAEHPDMADLTNQTQIAISASQGRANSERVWHYFGGNWDTWYGRNQYSPWEGSVQKLGAEVLWQATQGGALPAQAPGQGSGSGAAPGAGATAQDPISRALGWVKRNPLPAAGVAVALWLMAGRK